MSASIFWSWFERHAPRFAQLRDDPQEAVLDEIQARLHAYCEHLWFEVGGPPAGPMEFVISAEGNEDFFPEVQALADAAPIIPGWAVVAFKPPQGFDFVTSYEGLEIVPGQCWFLPLTSASEPGRLALRVGVPGYTAELSETIETALYLVVETGLGELVVGQRIAFIEACELPHDPERDGFIRVSELGEHIAEWSRRVDA